MSDKIIIFNYEGKQVRIVVSKGTATFVKANTLNRSQDNSALSNRIQVNGSISGKAVKKLKRTPSLSLWMMHIESWV